MKTYLKTISVIVFAALAVPALAQTDSGDRDALREAAVDALITAPPERALPLARKVVEGDYNDELTDPPSDNVFNVFLDKPQSYTFLTQPAALDNDYTFVPFQSMIDHVLITNDMLDDYGAGFTNILPFDVSIEDYDQVSDHRPVFVRLIKE